MTARENALEALLREVRDALVIDLNEVMARIDAALRAPKAQDPIRAALIRLLWRSVADGDSACDGGGNEDLGACEPGGLLDVCQAMRALGWGEHWDPEVFQQRATAQEQLSEKEMVPSALATSGGSATSGAVVADRGGPLPETHFGGPGSPVGDNPRAPRPVSSVGGGHDQEGPQGSGPLATSQSRSPIQPAIASDTRPSNSLPEKPSPASVEVQRLRVELARICDVGDGDDGTDPMLRLERCIEISGRALASPEKPPEEK